MTSGKTGPNLLPRVPKRQYPTKEPIPEDQTVLGFKKLDVANINIYNINHHKGMTRNLIWTTYTHRRPMLPVNHIKLPNISH